MKRWVEDFNYPVQENCQCILWLLPGQWVAEVTFNRVLRAVNGNCQEMIDPCGSVAVGAGFGKNEKIKNENWNRFFTSLLEFLKDFSRKNLNYFDYSSRKISLLFYPKYS